MAQADSDIGTSGFMVGRSPAFKRVSEMVAKLAACDASVLIEGETGTGKELLARALHYGSRRRRGPFIPVNCGALPEMLIESEMFGVCRGAYTDARSDRPGLVQSAQGGTLFLDEVDSLPAHAQVALLRFLQDGTFRPVGGVHEQRSDARVVAASNADLQDLVRSRAFRADLYFRLNLFVLSVPPLRDRGSDCVLLAEHFIRVFALRFGRPVRPLHPLTIDWLPFYAWPGNIRELENLVLRAFMLSEGETIFIEPVAANSMTARSGVPSAQDGWSGLLPYREARASALEAFDTAYVEQLLSQTHGNVTLAARLAGKERRAFGKLIKKYAINSSAFRSETQDSQAPRTDRL
ncbi:sigma-54 dependent transcriptional regulator [Ensifer sp.]|jgi:DNA-binding NtrC family response regulator|uniref:sigma-54 interaction domain-containing protein n=1 Tax=Ensifer sp. TaxID=1872086 RepID=UPI002E132B7B|nr:sigma-54 dependent transcriptional regulator [Ensifer sp.]